MPVIQRDDGVQFAVYTYREVLTAKRPSFLKQEIQMLQKENGNYCRFFPTATGDYEAVFSREEGYLLAETVWDYFDKPYDFIYCEILPHHKTALLVVVRAGSVYLDAEVNTEVLTDEFVTLVTGTNQYEIYIYGDVPLSATEEEGKITFEKSFVKSFNVLDEPLFPKLTINPAYKLLSVAKAMDELQLGKEKVPLYLVIIILAAVLGGVYWFLKPKSEVVEVQPQRPFTRPPPQDPYADYKRELTTPSPYNQLLEVTGDVRKLFSMPGWAPTEFTFNRLETKANLSSFGGTTEILLAWVRSNDATLTVDQGKAEILMPIIVANREPPKAIYDISDLISRLFDTTKAVLPEGSLSIGSTERSGNYIISNIEVSFNNVTVDVLMLFAEQLKDLPINLTEGQFTVQDGLLTGKISLQIVGAQL